MMRGRIFIPFFFCLFFICLILIRQKSSILDSKTQLSPLPSPNSRVEDVPKRRVSVSGSASAGGEGKRKKKESEKTASSVQKPSEITKTIRIESNSAERAASSVITSDSSSSAVVANEEEEASRVKTTTTDLPTKQSQLKYSQSKSVTTRLPFVNLNGVENLRNGMPYDTPSCGSCALVSSSGQMIDSGAGSAIDAHDCVIRMNVAPVKGYEKDVGNKSTIRIVSHTSVPFLLRDKNEFVARDPSLKAIIEWGPNDERRRAEVLEIVKETFLGKLKFNHVEFYTMTQETLVEEDKSFEAETGRNRVDSGSYLSTGWFTISFLRKLCNKVTVFGMVNDDFCRSKSRRSMQVPYHYWETQSSDLRECTTYLGHEFAQANVHRFMTEKKVFQRWAKLRKPPIQFLHPSWS